MARKSFLLQKMKSETMKIFISGASGLVGGNCLKHFSEKGWIVKGSHRTFPTENTVFFDTLDVTSANNFDLEAFKPDVIVHCGALTHVDYCENNPDESFEKTVTATKNLLEIAARCQAKFVFLSTDYVFDGKDGPYTETAEVNPLSVYGKHKLAAEKLVQQMAAEHLILRVTNIYGTEIRMKNFIARIISQCEEGKTLELKLPFDQFANPTNAFDIARAMALLLENQKSGIYHIGSTDYMNRVSLALRVLKYFPDAKYNLHPVSTESLAQPALRPLNGGFITAKFLSEFPDFLFSTVDEYMQNHRGERQH